MWEEGMQAIVAAALSEVSVPLAVFLPDPLIARPLGQCVQCPLLWGLLRVTGPILSQVGRGWSFSTFELPLGDMDPTSLPGIVFRRPQDRRTPPAVWRRSSKVRLAPDALAAAGPYADRVELAGWLIDEYRERGGEGLQQFISECCGVERSAQTRIGMVFDAMNARRAKVTPPGRRSSGMRLRAEAGRDAHVAGRDLSIVYQYVDHQVGALGRLSASEGAKLLRRTIPRTGNA